MASPTTPITPAVTLLIRMGCVASCPMYQLAKACSVCSRTGNTLSCWKACHTHVAKANQIHCRGIFVLGVTPWEDVVDVGWRRLVAAAAVALSVVEESAAWAAEGNKAPVINRAATVPASSRRRGDDVTNVRFDLARLGGPEEEEGDEEESSSALDAASGVAGIFRRRLWLFMATVGVGILLRNGASTCSFGGTVLVGT
jgi:hypothetical protein